MSSMDARYIVTIIMGVSGTGKTTLANALSKDLNMDFIEGDDLHSSANIEKMSNGFGLTDRDREPWLGLIRDTIERWAQRRELVGGGMQEEEVGLVVTCSALKKYYRDILRGSKEGGVVGSEDEPRRRIVTNFVYIKGRKEVILERLRGRKGHFMKSDMLDGQFEDLESPEGEEDVVVVVDAEDSVERQVERVKEKISR